ncbi:16S rRNA (cytidine(1402)-2'-O)-methyltransferase [Enterobacteriaceae endosymbiont of Plateumaris braccata]|uniref:16S rRNA (cytidine(1402)-2'-O)-methyltransferase n=1 Tax=Enterobacteriaceae endosymbiont of Plateumaris braccata TaxID=2675793 RepID=UPI00144971ED|nr:16S rRNA (cytidine(1402)-2'-O)-methyltransferase [Enterobacteriaceae endosymbiont of Plateumaris braccata]QJC27988.1 16S rRNA (cytidine(1402)-2'-O)-methyltransferase [Enterobacteriaceae endosymbiont of Plateumaris braccata]
MKKNQTILGNLYIVPTPIGNYNDINYRSLIILKKVNLILSEDKRKTGILLKYFNIKNKLYSYHEYNEKKKSTIILDKIKKGYNIALVSDSGTPLINDPGYRIVKLCRLENNSIKIIPIPGPCAAILALSASGLPSNKFCYEGFLPKKKNKRLVRLNELKLEKRTLIIYESKHKLLNSLYEIKNIFGENRYLVLAREITKKWECIYGDTVEKIILWIKKDKNRLKGEIVLVIDGLHNNIDEKISKESFTTLLMLKKYLPLKKAINITANIYKIKRNILYTYFLKNKY